MTVARPQEAERCLRKALEGRRRALGDDHPDTLSSINDMGLLLESTGKLREGESLFAAAVDGARRSLPEGHWQTGVYLTGYGTCLTKLGRCADAETALLEAHRILENAVGAERRLTLGAIKSLADLYDAWGKPEKAARWRGKLPGEATQRRSDEGTKGEQPATQPGSGKP